MEGSVLNFLKAEWKVSDTCSAHWASSVDNSGNLFTITVFVDIGGIFFTITIFVDISGNFFTITVFVDIGGIFDYHLFCWYWWNFLLSLFLLILVEFFWLSLFLLILVEFFTITVFVDISGIVLTITVFVDIGGIFDYHRFCRS